MDVETQAIIKQLKRKAQVLNYDGKCMGFFHGKQRGEEIIALLEMLERAVDRRKIEANSTSKSIGADEDTI